MFSIICEMSTEVVRVGTWCWWSGEWASLQAVCNRHSLH